LGGSYFLESLTDAIESKAREYIEEIDRMGGVVAGIESGYFQREIAESAFQYKREVDVGDRLIVGVNAHVEATAEPMDVLAIDPRWEAMHLERLRRVRSERNGEVAGRMLADLRKDAASDVNLMPSILNCVRAYCTLGEIVDALREVFGEYREQPIV
jgi:methylmalonyl-CoA mutase N-terminal domain/subunit